ncbi:hypothetical protein V6N12_069539 [Hibiscus sabdariffa]|uniref:ADF-H domain-containing protein n=1 Tax=Hibiscus sabdariffa TaxID=183260 RepID=A0ABR2FEB7_9ROSI
MRQLEQKCIHFKLIAKPNVASGMGVADQTKDTFLELKRKKAYLYVVEKIGAPVESYDDFTASLPETDCMDLKY